jgi:hypothetical protein
MLKVTTLVLVLAPLVHGSCSFGGESNGTPVPDDASGGPVNDGNPGLDADRTRPDASTALYNVRHVGNVSVSLLTANWEALPNTFIDTSKVADPTFRPWLFESKPQLGSATAPAVAVAFFESFTINTSVRVIGDKPLLIIAKRIVIGPGGGLFANARGSIPGPGGGQEVFGARGAGTGRVGDELAAKDSGGGGAGFGGRGANGGTSGPPPNPGAGGNAYGKADLPYLFSGSSGGNSPRCVVSLGGGGAGGGGVQLSALESITIDGIIHVGGGGGAGGSVCDGSNGVDTDAGDGGGSGGAIYLQSANIALSRTATLAANGGGGGAGVIATLPGARGNDGAPNALPAIGGSALGGTGGYGTTLPTVGANAMENASGGGGGVGRIVIAAPAGGISVTLGAQISPPEVRIP